MSNKVVRIAGLAAGGIAALFGGWTPGLTILSVMMAVDYLTGVLVAITGKSPKSESGGLSSKAGFAGIARKGFIMLIVLVATQLDKAIGRELFKSLTVFYYIANEGLSILENAERMGVPTPAALKKRLETMRDADRKPNGEI